MLMTSALRLHCSPGAQRRKRNYFLPRFGSKSGDLQNPYCDSLNHKKLDGVTCQKKTPSNAGNTSEFQFGIFKHLCVVHDNSKSTHALIDDSNHHQSE
jgi:hypothetical protein